MITPIFLPVSTRAACHCRKDAARALAGQLAGFAKCGKSLVMALPKTSISLAVEIALHLQCSFDVLWMARVIAPGATGDTIGAVADEGVKVLDHSMIEQLQLSEAEISAATRDAGATLAQGKRLYFGRRPALAVAQQSVILVDDGSTPGATLRDAIRLLRRQQVAHIVVALCSASRQAAGELGADAVVTLGKR